MRTLSREMFAFLATAERKGCVGPFPCAATRLWRISSLRFCFIRVCVGRETKLDVAQQFVEARTLTGDKLRYTNCADLSRSFRVVESGVRRANAMPKFQRTRFNPPERRARKVESSFRRALILLGLRNREWGGLVANPRAKRIPKRGKSRLRFAEQPTRPARCRELSTSAAPFKGIPSFPGDKFSVL